MRNLWIVLVSLSLFSFGTQTYAKNEGKDPKKPKDDRAASASAKANKSVKADSKAKTQSRDSAKRPPDPLEKGASKQRDKKNQMPPDDFGKGTQSK